MTIHQISIFLENKNGALLKVLNLLKEAHIQIVASTISDTVEYCIDRIELSNTPGEAAKAIDLFTTNNININYMYSFLFNAKGIVIFKTNDTEKTREVIALNKLNFISEDQLCQINL